MMTMSYLEFQIIPIDGGGVTKVKSAAEPHLWFRINASMCVNEEVSDR